MTPYIKWLNEVGSEDLEEVGGKNASLGEMLKNLEPLGIRVPGGYAVTAEAYREYIASNELEDAIRGKLESYRRGDATLEQTGRAIRKMIVGGIFPTRLAESIREAYDRLSVEYDIENVDVAVRSSATAEDLPGASFAGLQETYLNVSGKEELMKVCKRCFASLFTERAIAYREEKGFDHMKIALSVGVQKMIKADGAGSGVMFTLDTETGFPDLVLINAGWGLGELVVQGLITPDQYLVYKPLLEKKGARPILEKKIGGKEMKMVYSTPEDGYTRSVPTSLAEQNSAVLDDDDILRLAKWGVAIEEHYGRPMDIEWVKEDGTDELYIVQARPETVHTGKGAHLFNTYRLKEKGGEPLVTGQSIGSAIAHGGVCRVETAADLEAVTQGSILVAEMTEPDWVSAMKNISGIVTDFGGRTCHAAIVSRELGIPAIVGSGNATDLLENGKRVTLSCAQGESGSVYEGWLEYEMEEMDLQKLPEVDTEIMLNLAAPGSAFKWWQLPVDGVGLARMEFIIGNHIRIHPMALVHFDQVAGEEERNEIRRLTKNYRNRSEYFVDKLAEGIARIAASQYPNPVILRTSDFKTNEYAGLLGGSAFESSEDNPMLGWRGASRYYSDGYREGFALECRAIKKVREQIGLDNVVVMIPFCRTLAEAERVLEELAGNGLVRGDKGLQVYMMCEIPSNLILIEEFAEYFDGFSIGSNDLTQLILGVDRDAAELSYLFDENDLAVKKAVRDIIQRAHAAGSRVGFCGQAPSDDPAYAAFLVECGIDSISLNPDSVAGVIGHVSKSEASRTSPHGETVVP